MATWKFKFDELNKFNMVFLSGSDGSVPAMVLAPAYETAFLGFSYGWPLPVPRVGEGISSAAPAPT